MSCILIRCTYDKNLQMIQPLLLVEELQFFYMHSTFCVFGFGPLVPKPRIRLDRNLVCDLLLRSSTYYMYKDSGSIALSWFSKMATGWPYFNSDRAKIW
jgi:hypothetical protein